MEFKTKELQVVELPVEQQAAVALSEFELALVGGGFSDVVFG